MDTQILIRTLKHLPLREFHCIKYIIIVAKASEPGCTIHNTRHYKITTESWEKHLFPWTLTNQEAHGKTSWIATYSRNQYKGNYNNWKQRIWYFLCVHRLSLDVCICSELLPNNRLPAHILWEEELPIYPLCHKPKVEKKKEKSLWLCYCIIL